LSNKFDATLSLLTVLNYVKPKGKEMKNMKTLISLTALTVLLTLASAQDKPPVKVSPAEAKSHVGEVAIVCGKVVDSKINKYGIADHGKPVMLDLDQPEPDPVFYFVTFGSKDGGPEEAVKAFKDKSVCVTGKITLASGIPYIMAADRTNVKIQPENKTTNK